jgi:hypothetical protein
MVNIYYTARQGRRNGNGHTTTRGEVYKIQRGDNTTPHGEDALELIGEYVHQSGGAGLEREVLNVCEKAGIDTNGGYYKNWREAVNLIEI